MYGSKYLGGGIGGYGVAKLMSETSLDTALIARTVILLAIMLVPIFVRERDTPPEPAPSATTEPWWRRAWAPMKETLGALGQAFSLRSSNRRRTAHARRQLLDRLDIGATGYPLYITKLGWTYEELTVIAGGWGLADRWNLRRAHGLLRRQVRPRVGVAAIASCALALGWIAFSLLEPYWHVRTLIYISGFYEAACQATLSVALISLCMDLTWPRDRRLDVRRIHGAVELLDDARLPVRREDQLVVGVQRRVPGRRCGAAGGHAAAHPDRPARGPHEAAAACRDEPEPARAWSRSSSWWHF